MYQFNLFYVIYLFCQSYMLNGGLNKTNSGHANVSENKLGVSQHVSQTMEIFPHFSTDIMNTSIIKIYTSKYINIFLISAILKRLDIQRNLY